MRPAGCPARVLLLAAVLVALAALPAAPQQSGCGPSRVVAVGDTLTNVAARCGVTPEALLEANPFIRDPDILPLGATIVVPDGSGGPADVTGSSPLVPAAGVAPVRVLPTDDPSRGRVRVLARDLPAGAPVLIGAGTHPRATLFFARARVSAGGVLSEMLDLPAWARGDAPVHVVVEAPIGGALLRAAPYQAAAGP